MTMWRFLRGNVITLYRFGSITLWIIAATPELLAGVGTFLGHTLDHRLTAQWTGGSVGMNALLFTVGKAFCRQSFCEASFNLEHLQLAFYLATNHHDKSIAKHQQAVGDDKRIFAREPLVKFMLLGKNVNTAFV